MNCKKCKAAIPDGAVYCPWCGRKQFRDKLKHEKRPNGAGSVYKLPGKRKRPWAAVISKSHKKRVYIGYYASKAEAMLAISRACAKQISDSYNDTIASVYDAWKKVHFPELSSWGVQGYETAWTYFDEIKHIKMRDVKTDTLQSVIDKATAAGKSRSICEKIRNLASQLCQYSMQRDIISKNYAQFLVLPKKEPKEKSIFTDDEIATLFAHSDDKNVRIILTLIYTGFRLNELLSVEVSNVNIDDGYIIAGEKTDAGKNRLVPISNKIMPFIREWYDTAKKNGYKYLLVNSQGGKMLANNFRKRGFYKVLGDLGIQPHIDKDHPASKYARLTPHSTRHTFASLAARAGVEPKTLQTLIGHAHYTTTADVYIHENIKQLKEGISKL
jgi:integrase